MGGVNMMDESVGFGGVWEQIKSRGRLVYWRRKLGKHSWLAVKRRRDGRWTWDYYLRDEIQAGGDRSTSVLARKAADRYMEAP